MDKKTFTKITKEVFLEYGFIKEKNEYILLLKDVTIVVKFSSWRGVKYFNYYFFINALYDSNIELKNKFDTLVEIKMEHDPSAQGYHKHEILFEQYTEDAYRKLLVNMLHTYFDAYKENALKFLKENDYCMSLTKKAREYLGLTDNEQ